MLKQAAANDSAHGRLRPSSVRGAARSAQACLFFFFFFADWRLAAQLGRIWPSWPAGRLLSPRPGRNLGLGRESTPPPGPKAAQIDRGR